MKNKGIHSVMILEEVTGISAEFLLRKTDAVMLNVDTVLKAMESYAEAIKEANVRKDVESEDTTSDESSELELTPKEILCRNASVYDAMMKFGKQCFHAGERVRDHYYHDPNSEVTRKKLGYLFFDAYIKYLKVKKQKA